MSVIHSKCTTKSGDAQFHCTMTIKTILLLFLKLYYISYPWQPGYRNLLRYKFAARQPRDHISYASVKGWPMITSGDLEEDKQTIWQFYYHAVVQCDWEMQVNNLYLTGGSLCEAGRHELFHKKKKKKFSKQVQLIQDGLLDHPRKLREGGGNSLKNCFSTHLNSHQVNKLWWYGLNVVG